MVEYMCISGYMYTYMHTCSNFLLAEQCGEVAAHCCGFSATNSELLGGKPRTRLKEGGLRSEGTTEAGLLGLACVHPAACGLW